MEAILPRSSTPLGLMIADGKRTGGFQKSDLLTAVVMMRKGRPALLVWQG